MSVSGIIINLEGPICQCAEENLRWSVEVTRCEEPEAFLVVSCAGCGVEHSVPCDRILGTFDMATPYPGTPARPRPKLEVLPGGKLIPFPEGGQ